MFGMGKVLSCTFSFQGASTRHVAVAAFVVHLIVHFVEATGATKCTTKWTTKYRVRAAPTSPP